MSNVTGAIKFKDGLIRFYEYYGTSDVCDSTHYATTDEVSANWRKDIYNKCVCGNMEPVSIYSDYGGGFYFKGTACKPCNFLDHEYDFSPIYRDKSNDDWIKDVWVDEE